MEGTEYIDELERCRALAKEWWLVDPTVTIDWSLSGLKAGEFRGMANGQGLIRLNLHIAKNEGEKYLVTVAHEYAHAVVWVLGKRDGCKYDSHGDMWQDVMWRFGHNPRRCHQFQSAEPARHVEKFRYVCHCGPVQLVGPTINRKIKQGHVYRCRKCRGTLQAAPLASAESLLSRIGQS